MPLTALNGKGELLMSMNCDENVRNEKLNCPHCNEKMVFVNPYQYIIKHFRHKRTCPYSTEPESKEHIAMKSFFCQQNKECKPEIKIGNRIADVVLGDVVIECQVSTITMRELIERTQSYNSAGYYVAWVLHPKNFLHVFDSTTPTILSDETSLFDWENEYEKIKPRKIEKFLHHLMYGRVYYFGGGRNYVVPIHYVFEYYSGLGKSRRFLKRHEPLERIFPLLKRNNLGFKIALFGDVGMWWK